MLSRLFLFSPRAASFTLVALTNACDPCTFHQAVKRINTWWLAMRCGSDIHAVIRTWSQRACSVAFRCSLSSWGHLTSHLKNSKLLNRIFILKSTLDDIRQSHHLPEYKAHNPVGFRMVCRFKKQVYELCGITVTWVTDLFPVRIYVTLPWAWRLASSSLSES